jgi:hypothetical protein
MNLRKCFRTKHSWRVKRRNPEFWFAVLRDNHLSLHYEVHHNNSYIFIINTKNAAKYIETPVWKYSEAKTMSHYCIRTPSPHKTTVLCVVPRTRRFDTVKNKTRHWRRSEPLSFTSQDSCLQFLLASSPTPSVVFHLATFQYIPTKVRIYYLPHPSIRLVRLNLGDFAPHVASFYVFFSFPRLLYSSSSMHTLFLCSLFSFILSPGNKNARFSLKPNRQVVKWLAYTCLSYEAKFLSRITTSRGVHSISYHKNLHIILRIQAEFQKHCKTIRLFLNKICPQCPAIHLTTSKYTAHTASGRHRRRVMAHSVCLSVCLCYVIIRSLQPMQTAETFRFAK